jgi:23S rRNA (uracil1939-C5)-methyltransferase
MSPQQNSIRLEIQGLGSHGEGVGKIDGYTLFVDGALPGETVTVSLLEKRQTYATAKLLSIDTPSLSRVKPICPLFGTCGGCQVMHLAYEKQLEMKRQKVIDALTRIGKIEAKVNPCIASSKELYYRNKIQLPSQDGELGLYEKNSHKLVILPKCYIHCDLGEKIFAKVKKIIPPLKSLRHVLIKSAVKTNEALVILVTKKQENLSQVAQQIMQECPEVKGVVHNLHQGKENIILGPTFKLIAGQGTIQETICDLTFKVSPGSFFQVNPGQAEQLYKQALSAAELTGKESVLDAYCGVGTLSLIFAKKAKKVTGVEKVHSAIQDAKENSKINKIGNVEFIAQDAAHYIQTAPAFDLILLNPPRKGCDPLFLDGLIKAKPKKLLYISCDPATLARDLALLKTAGYQVDLVQPFDMFPQTAHVETLVRLIS